jgi:transcriptional regulator with XRE-family HTH domain
MKGEKLNEYVTRVMRQKNLNARDVERNSGYKINNSHVSKLMKGLETNPSMNAVSALAEGLDVNPHEILTATTGRPPDDSPPAVDLMEMLGMIEKLASDHELIEALRGLLRLSKQERAVHLRVMRLPVEEKKIARRNKSGKKKGR